MPDADPPLFGRSLLPATLGGTNDGWENRISVGHHQSPSTTSLSSLYTLASLSSSASASTSSSNDLVTPPPTPSPDQDKFRSPRIRPLGARPRPTLVAAPSRSAPSQSPEPPNDTHQPVTPSTSSSQSHKRSFGDRFESLSSAIEQQLRSSVSETSPTVSSPNACAIPPSTVDNLALAKPPRINLSISPSLSPSDSSYTPSHQSQEASRDDRNRPSLRRSETLSSMTSPISPQSSHKRQYSSLAELPRSKPNEVEVVDWDRLDRVLGTWKASRRAASREVEEVLEKRVRSKGERSE